MKKTFRAGALAFALFSCFLAHGQDRNVTVLRFSYPAGDETAETLAATAESVIARGIKYLGTYRLLPTPAYAVGTSAEKLAAFARATASEYVVFGSLKTGTAGETVIEGAVYSSVDGSRALFRETADSALAIFGAADALSLSILSEVYRVEVSYGALSVRMPAGIARWDVYVNGTLAASNATAVANVPAGEVRVRVVSRSGASAGQIVYEDAVRVAGNESSPIAVTWQSPAEKIAGRTDRGALTVTSEPVGLIVAVDGGAPKPTPYSVEVAPGTHALETFVSVINDRYYGEREESAIAVAAGRETVASFTPRSENAPLSIPSAAETCAFYLDGTPIPVTAARPYECPAGCYYLTVIKDGEPVFAQYVWIERKVGYSYEWGKTIATAHEIESRAIPWKIDAGAWTGVTAFFSTTRPSAYGGDDAYGITSVQMARDGKYAYWRVVFNGKNPLSAARSGDSGALAQLTVKNAMDYRNLTLTVSGQGPGQAAYWNYKTDRSESFIGGPDKISGEGEIVARVALKTLRKRVAIASGESVKETSLTLADPSWKRPLYVPLGYVNYAFLAE